MARQLLFFAAANDGLSGHTVRAAVEAPQNLEESAAQAVAAANEELLKETIQRAADFLRHAADLTGQALEQAVDAASDSAFQAAANVGTNIASPQGIGQSSFSWGGYFQAIGVLCILLAALWFGVWLIRKYGKFNFLPRPGALPKDALIMEAQMPLGPKKGLMVVRFLNRRLLLGVTEHQITLLTEDNAQNERKDFKDIIEEARNADADSGIGGPSA